MKFRSLLLLIGIALIPFSSVQAIVAYEVYPVSEYEDFQFFYEIESPELTVPNELIIEMPANYELGYALVEETTGKAQATKIYFDYESDVVELIVSENSALKGDASALTDGDYSTTAEFDLDADEGYASVVLDVPVESNRALSSSELRLSLDDNVALPYEIAISVWGGDDWETVLARQVMTGATVYFPETEAYQWKIELWHSQPLRVREIKLIDSNASTSKTGVYLVWLGRPNETYKLYTDAAHYTSVDKEEGGQLEREEALEAQLGPIQENTAFIDTDGDGDGVVDEADNCIGVFNPEQSDINENGLGDECEDYDGDGWQNYEDNCPNYANRSQQDTDGDGIGDACDDEESRLTERMPWLPWLAISLTAMIVLGIVLKTLKSDSK